MRRQTLPNERGMMAIVRRSIGILRVTVAVLPLRAIHGQTRPQVDHADNVAPYMR
ncbi:MAG TPA: hypothetical protein VJ596_02110 [Gemmatimonadaceae bacterium]|nr:hypothetical protein [Gemmatimonadaceae bacterium]